MTLINERNPVRSAGAVHPGHDIRLELLVAGVKRVNPITVNDQTAGEQPGNTEQQRYDRSCALPRFHYIVLWANVFLNRLRIDYSRKHNRSQKMNRRRAFAAESLTKKKSSSVASNPLHIAS